MFKRLVDDILPHGIAMLVGKSNRAAHGLSLLGLRWRHRTEAIVSDVIEIYASTQRPSKRQAVIEARNRIKSKNQRRRGDGMAELALPSECSLLRRRSSWRPTSAA